MRRSPIKKALEYLSSLDLFISLLLCVSLGAALAVHFLDIGFLDALDLLPARVFLGLMLLNRISGFSLSSLKNAGAAVFNAGMMLALIAILSDSVFGFRGISWIIEGETRTGYDRADKQPLGRISELPVTVESIEGELWELGKDSEVRLRTGEGDVFALKPGESGISDSGREIKLLGVGVSAGYVLSDENGAGLSSGLANLRLYPKGEQDYFVVDALPHRFYLSLTGDKDKPLHLRIFRGKLLKAESDISGENVKFDGMNVSFPEIGKWAAIEVRRRFSMAYLYAGLALAALGAIYWTVSKRAE